MASKQEMLDMLKEALRLEENTVLVHLDGSLRELELLNLQPSTEKEIRAILDKLRSESLEHRDKFSKAIEDVEGSARDEY